MIHRAVLGTLERFIGVLLEHTGGVLPFWLAPEQVRVLSLSEKVEDYAAEVTELIVQHRFSRQRRPARGESSASRCAKRNWPKFLTWPWSESARQPPGWSRSGACAAKKIRTLTLDGLIELLKAEPLPC